MKTRRMLRDYLKTGTLVVHLQSNSSQSNLLFVRIDEVNP